MTTRRFTFPHITNFQVYSTLGKAGGLEFRCLMGWFACETYLVIKLLCQIKIGTYFSRSILISVTNSNIFNEPFDWNYVAHSDLMKHFRFRSWKGSRSSSLDLLSDFSWPEHRSLVFHWQYSKVPFSLETQMMCLLHEKIKW